MIVDIIFLSNTVDVEQYGNTQRAINTLLLADSSDTEYNIIIVESNKDHLDQGFHYHGCNVVIPDEEFNYNRFLNKGLEHTKGGWVIISNNDVIFTQHWLWRILEFNHHNPGYHSFSPYEPKWHKDKAEQSGIYGDLPFYEGYRTSFEITGWCIVMKPELIKTCELFDERFKFWYQDNDYAKTIESKGFKHALVTDSRVYHMVSKSYSTIPKDKLKNMTDEQCAVFRDKWGPEC